jgi:hypothetical protein
LGRKEEGVVRVKERKEGVVFSSERNGSGKIKEKKSCVVNDQNALSTLFLN